MNKKCYSFCNFHPDIAFTLEESQLFQEKRQIQAMTGNSYIPHRDNTYWVLHLVGTTNPDLKNKQFIRQRLISPLEERHPYWLRSLDDVVKAFE